MADENRCQAMALGKCRCTKDDRNHISGDTAEERLHEHELTPGDTLRWGSTADVVAIFGPMTCDEEA